MRKTAEIQRTSVSGRPARVSVVRAHLMEAGKARMNPLVLDQQTPDRSDIHPALRSFADECSAVFVRILAYVCGLAVLAVIVTDLITVPPVAATATAIPVAPGWTHASRPHPAFAISKLDLSDRTDAYEILRHPDGGRKDTLRWAASAAEAPNSEIEIYRPGTELSAFAAPEADIAARMGLHDALEAQAAGVVETKFGTVQLFRFGGTSAKAQTCLGFAKSFDQPRLRISGYSCQGEHASAQRTHLSCTLNRLILLSAGNDPKLAELFARAELKRASCAAPGTLATEWLTGPQEPSLRGRI